MTKEELKRLKKISRELLGVDVFWLRRNHETKARADKED